MSEMYSGDRNYSVAGLCRELTDLVRGFRTGRFAIAVDHKPVPSSTDIRRGDGKAVKVYRIVDTAEE